MDKQNLVCQRLKGRSCIGVYAEKNFANKGRRYLLSLSAVIANAECVPVPTCCDRQGLWMHPHSHAVSLLTAQLFSKTHQNVQC